MLANAGAQPSGDQGLTDAVRGFEAALRNRDFSRAIAAWEFPNHEQRQVEEGVLRGVFSAAQVVFTTDSPARTADGGTAVTVGTLTQISEPRGAVEQWSLLWKLTPLGWRIISRETFGGIDGMVHLDLQNEGFIADGQTIELEDFTLQMMDGVFFLNTQEAGPTALVFVGKGRVTFSPRPATERGQMRLFAKSEKLEDEVSRAFLRLHPADLYRTLRPGSFAADLRSSSRLRRAREFFERHKGDAFVLDAPIPGAPWWLLPALGDSAVAFETRRFGTLTLSLSSFEREGVSLFNRTTQKQISVYPRADAPLEDEGDERFFDVVHQDISLSLNPDTFELTGAAVTTIDVRSPVTSFRFQLDNDLRVKSVRSAQGGRHLFFRVRGQNSVLVSMGSLTGRIGRFDLRVEYGGRLPAGTVDSEILQGQTFTTEESSFFIDPALIYSRRRWFYPQMGDDDYATSTLNVSLPTGWTVLSGGVRSEKTDVRSSTITYEQSQGGKYVAFLAARLQPIARERGEPLSFEAWSQSRTRREGLRAVDTLKEASRFFEGLFGKAPYSPLSLGVVEAQTPGGHSPPGLIILQQRPPLMGGGLKDDPATFYEIPGFFLAHELAHQWWGHGVTPSSYRDRWVAEGFAQYAAALWTREAQGEATFARVLRKMISWARRMNHLGPVDLGNRVGHIQNNAQAHRAIVYNKGALVLDMVRRVIGDDAFGRGLRKLQADHGFRRVNTSMVQRAFEAEGGVDLGSLWEVFVRNTALPSMKIETREGFQELVVEGYAGPLPVTVQVDGVRRDVIVRGRMRLPEAGASARVVLDPDGVSLATVRK